MSSYTEGQAFNLDAKIDFKIVARVNKLTLKTVPFKVLSFYFSKRRLADAITFLSEF